MGPNGGALNHIAPMHAAEHGNHRGEEHNVDEGKDPTPPRERATALNRVGHLPRGERVSTLNPLGHWAWELVAKVTRH